MQKKTYNLYEKYAQLTQTLDISQMFVLLKIYQLLSHSNTSIFENKVFAPCYLTRFFLNEKLDEF